MWGRSSFFSNTTRSAPAAVYLARATVPVIPTTALSWQYYASGSWVSNQANATALTATGGWGDGPINSMSIVYLKDAGKWLMLYGGGIPPLWDLAFGGGISTGSTYNTVFPDPNTSGIKFRTAPHPWGPWSAATTVLKPNDAVISSKLCPPFPLPIPPGLVCNPAAFPEQGPGVLYGANIVDRWTTSGPGTATIGWLVSTWNPYQVDQMKTVLSGI
jgi:hypothetical protein